MKHPRDPMHLHHAAQRLGAIVAEGEMSDADASDTIVSLAAKAHGVDRSGLQARLHWTMRDAAEAHRRARENAYTAVRWAVRPLMQANAPKAAIEEAAARAGGDILGWEELVVILRNEWDALHGRRRRG